MYSPYSFLIRKNPFYNEPIVINKEPKAEFHPKKHTKSSNANNMRKAKRRRKRR